MLNVVFFFIFSTQSSWFLYPNSIDLYNKTNKPGAPWNKHAAIHIHLIYAFLTFRKKTHLMSVDLSKNKTYNVVGK